MSTRDVSHLTDITKCPQQADGSYQRPQPFSGRRGETTRALIVRKLKGLGDFIGKHGWPFANIDSSPGADADPINGAEHVKDLYFKAEPNYEGRFTVPVLWDKRRSTIVNNESSEIIRILNSAFDDQLPADKATLHLYPEPLRKEINEINEWVYDTINNGVYKAGFATSQKAYEAAVIPLFQSLDRLEKILTGKDYLVGNQLTEADIRLFVTIVRFDPVYVGHFKCNIRT
ncbi:glutathione S-transferase, partial [Fomes fomentarius]